MTELKPCPKGHIVTVRQNGNGWFVECPICNYGIPNFLIYTEYHMTKWGAVKAWNRRVNEDGNL